MNKLVISNLLNRPIRSIISVVAIAVEVTLILLIVGLSVGIMNDARERQVGVGADVMVQPPGSSFLAGITGSPVSIKVADKLRTLPHVTAVAPVVMNLNTSGAIEVIYGIDLQSFNALARSSDIPFVIVKPAAPAPGTPSGGGEEQEEDEAPRWEN